MDKKQSLRATAPGLFSSLMKTLSPEDLTHIEKCYEEVLSRGGADEFPIVREVDASFNPRPARIATIVLTNTKPTHLLRAIELGLWSCLIRDSGVSTLLLEAPEDIVRALHRIHFIESNVDSDIDEVIVALAVHLDQVRHLHMTNLSPEDKSSLLFRAEKLVTALLPSHVELPILKKVSHAIQQQRRILEDRS